MASLRTAVEALDLADETRPYGRMILRAGVALLYAHWEGFVGQSCQHYLDYVAKRRLKYSELSKPFVMTSLRPMSQRASTSSTDLIALAELVTSGGSGRARIPRTGVVETGSNLRYDRLVAMFESLGLDYTAFEVRQHLIDQRLCDARNEITHGKERYPTSVALLELQDLVLEMMEHVRSLLLNAVVMTQYRA